MTDQRKIFEKRCQVLGWILFITCAIFYLAAGIRARDLLSILGSLIFLVACFVFLIPYLFPDRTK